MHKELIVLGEREDCVWAGINAYNNEEDVTASFDSWTRGPAERRPVRDGLATPSARAGVHRAARAVATARRKAMKIIVLGGAGDVGSRPWRSGSLAGC